MKKDTLSRAQLDSMSTTELISLCDEYGISVPDDLNRLFIIGELLEASMESQPEEESVKIVEDDGDMPENLPKSYNNTCVDAILRNPAWLFVFWDIKESDSSSLKSDPAFTDLFLHVSFPKSEDDRAPEYSFDVNIDFENNEQYVLIPSGNRYVKIDLAASFNGKKTDVLASSRYIEIPCENEKIQNMVPGKELDFSELIRLSGMKKILHDHYLNHRQSFTE